MHEQEEENASLDQILENECLNKTETKEPENRSCTPTTFKTIEKNDEKIIILGTHKSHPPIHHTLERSGFYLIYNYILTLF